jgi:4-hydroxybenzoyl-CoA thioesterase
MVNPTDVTIFQKARRIRFSDCDPAGIVFYPQYFVLFNDFLEEWMDLIFEGGFAGYILHRRLGMPTVRVEADFRNVSRMGDEVVLSLRVIRVGDKSFELALECVGSDGQRRMTARQTLVTTSLETHRSIPIAPELRESLLRYLSGGPEGAGTSR